MPAGHSHPCQPLDIFFWAQQPKWGLQSFHISPLRQAVDSLLTFSLLALATRGHMNHENVFTLDSPDERLWLGERPQPNLNQEGKERRKSQDGGARERRHRRERGTRKPKVVTEAPWMLICGRGSMKGCSDKPGYALVSQDILSTTRSPTTTGSHSLTYPQANN